MSNHVEIITANFEGNGLLTNKLCVYIISFICEEDIQYYVGKTGTTNNTGVHAPFQRLANHFIAKGNTGSCIFNKKTNDTFLDAKYYSNIKFYSVCLDNNDDATAAEKWLYSQMTKHGKKLVNHQNYTNIPQIPADLKEKLIALLDAAKLSDVVRA